MIRQALYGYRYTDGYIFGSLTKGRKHVWLVAMPKSGSTWLTELMRKVLGWSSVPMVCNWGKREQMIEPRCLMMGPRGKDIFSPHTHTAWSEHVTKVVNGADIQIVLLTRNLFDTVVSLKDHYDRERVGPLTSIYPGAWDTFDERRKYDALVDLAVPWYMNWFVGWFYLRSGIGRNRIFEVTYEWLRERPYQVLYEITKWLGEPKSVAELEAVIKGVGHKKTRFNKGVSGRGKELMSPEQLARVQDFTRYFPGVDFSRIGL